MLSIDETIAHVREVAEEQRKLFRLCPYPSQECNGADICKCLKNKHDGCIKCAEENEQIAEWLELLKWYEQGMEDIPCESGVLPKDVYSSGYIKAIDDLMEKASECSISDADWHYLGQVAEQLKAGGENERM